MAKSLKEQLKQGKICTGTFMLLLSGGDAAQFFAGLGFDFFILDMEHSMLDLERVRDTIRAARACGIAPIVRVPELCYHLIARVLDAGAEGIVLPRIETAEEARNFVQIGRYPPKGRRGISTFAGHSDFKKIPDVPAFIEQRNRDIMLIAMVETVRGVENREDIFAVSGIDAGIVGTGDLAMSMGLAGQLNHPDVLAQAELVLETCRKKDLIASIPIRRAEDVQYWVDYGLNMLTFSTDSGFISSGADIFKAALEKALKQ